VSFSRPAMDIEQIVSELRGRIDEDIRKNIFPQDHQIPDRYLYHLRELLKEDNAAHGLIQLRRTGTDSGEKIDTFTTFGSVSAVDAPDQQPDIPERAVVSRYSSGSAVNWVTSLDKTMYFPNEGRHHELRGTYACAV